MAMSRKIDPFYFRDIRRFHPRVEGLVVSSPLDKMLLNTVFVTVMYRKRRKC
jgi:hypothetical protein